MAFKKSNRGLRDRFIPSRFNTNFEISAYLINRKEEKEDLDDPNILLQSPQLYSEDMTVNTSRRAYARENYRRRLWSAMFGTTQTKILNFHKEKKASPPHRETQPGLSWPVYPRPEPLLKAPTNMFDMPNLDTNICLNVIDWSKTGFLTTIYEGQIHMYNPLTCSSGSIKSNDTVQNCIRWNREGTMVAAGIFSSRYSVAIWDNVTDDKVYTHLTCPCLLSNTVTMCSASALEWTNSPNCIVMGCTNGRLTSFDVRRNKVMSSSPQGLISKSCEKAHTSRIICIKFSCKETYLVSCSTNCEVVVWSWFPSTVPIFCYKSEHAIRAIAWHPWKDSLLALGQVSALVLIDVPSRKRIERKHKRCVTSVDYLTFNPVSAELVVSSYNDVGINYLTVYKDLDSIVDEVQYHASPVPYLLWDPSSAMLATASGDENLCIWDFFGGPKEMEKYFPSCTKKKELTTNMLKTVDMFGPTIR